MKVRSGWSSEYAKKKFDVELDETDLFRIITGAGLPEHAVGEVTLREAFDILHTSAEIIARETLIQFDPSLKQSLLAEATVLADKRRSTLTGVRSRLEATEELHKAHGEPG